MVFRAGGETRGKKGQTPGRGLPFFESHTTKRKKMEEVFRIFVHLFKKKTTYFLNENTNSVLFLDDCSEVHLNWKIVLKRVEFFII